MRITSLATTVSPRCMGLRCCNGSPARVPTALATVAAAAGLVLLAGVSARAQNLIVNNGFASGLAGWSDYGSANAADGTRTPIPLAAQMDVSDTAPSGTIIGLAQCVGVDPSTNYAYGGDYRLPTGQSVDDGARVLIGVLLYDGAGCSGPFGLGSVQGVAIAGAGALDDAVWHPAAGPFWLTTGAATASARFVMYVQKTTAAASAYRGHFRLGYLYREGSVPVELLAFGAE